MYAHNCWYVAGWDHEVQGDRLHAIRIADEPVVIYRRQDGALVALEDRCRHRFAPLSLGRREGDDLRCMYHGFKFAPSGRCIEIPGEGVIPEIARVRSYPVESRHSWIWVWIGDPLKADAALIPPAAGFDDARWCLRHGQLDYAASYELINDNLLDFTHLSYVHRSSFGAGPAFALERPRVTRLPRGVRVDRWMRPSAANVSLRADRPVEQLDFYSGYDFLVPGVLLMFSGIYPAGTRAATGDGTPSLEQAVSGNFTSQAVTPMTADTARYFFSLGPERGCGGRGAGGRDDQGRAPGVRGGQADHRGPAPCDARRSAPGAAADQRRPRGADVPAPDALDDAGRRAAPGGGIHPVLMDRLRTRRAGRFVR